MKRVPDRKRLRREYLKRKGKAYTQVAASQTLLLPAGVASLGFAMAAVGGWYYWKYYADWAYWIKYLSLSQAIVACIAAGGLSVVFGLLTWHLNVWKRQARTEAATLVYVPPVTLSTLPAEEILVRGTQEPAAGSETLLRATVKGEETKAEELLRSSTSG